MVADDIGPQLLWAALNPCPKLGEAQGGNEVNQQSTALKELVAAL